jgi:hypothetical protein
MSNNSVKQDLNKLHFSVLMIFASGAAFAVAVQKEGWGFASLIVAFASGGFGISTYLTSLKELTSSINEARKELVGTSPATGSDISKQASNSASERERRVWRDFLCAFESKKLECVIALADNFENYKKRGDKNFPISEEEYQYIRMQLNLWKRGDDRDKDFEGLLQKYKKNFLYYLGEIYLYYEKNSFKDNGERRLDTQRIVHDKLHKALQDFSDAHKEVMKEGHRKFPDINTDS